MDAFDNPARNGGAGSQRDGASVDRSNLQANGAVSSQPVEGNDFLAGAANVTAAASAMPLAIQGVLVPDASGRIVLPAGVSMDDIRVSGSDLVITLPNGQLLVVPNGAIDIPAIVVDGDTVPASTVAQLLENLGELNPEVGVRSSGGNFADPEGAIQDPYALGDLLPYTQLAFAQPENRELLPDVPDEEPTISIITPDQPTGAVDATSSVDEAGLPVRGSEPAGSNSAANSETVTGSIIIDAPDGLVSVTINGTAVTGVGQVITTPLGQLTVTSVTPGTIGYSYTLADNTNANANPTDVFDVVVTDRDGDTAAATLTVSVADDVPTARADTDALAPAARGPETGNVLTGAGTTSGAPGADTQGADGATLTGISGAGSEGFAAPGTVQGQYGVLTIAADGSYSYVRNPGTPGGVNDVFTYRITDGDGDTSTATLTIAIGDAPPVITFIPVDGDGGDGDGGGEGGGEGEGEGDAGTLVREADLAARGDEAPGSQFDGDAASTSGTISFAAPDGVGSVAIAGVTVTPGLLPQQVFSDATGTLVVTGYSYDAQTGQGSITYVYTLVDNVLDGDGSTVSFDVAITDLDGDVDSGTLDIDIIDDVPTALPDVDGVSEDGGDGEGAPTADGNVLTGLGGGDANATDGVADTQGADGTVVTGLAGGALGEPSAGAYGTLTLNADGSYAYVLNNQAQPVQGLSAGETLTEIFTYTITDGDGDTSTTTLTIIVNGADDGVTVGGLDGEGAELAVDEDDLPARAGEAPGSDTTPGSLTDSDSFSVSTPDGMGAVTLTSFNGVPLGAPLTLVTANGNFTPQSVATAYGTLNVTGFAAVTGADGSVIGGTFTYSYTLNDNRTDHPLAGEDSRTDRVGVNVTDSDGSTASANIDIRITDDVPDAIDDGKTQTIENAPVTINVLANDVQGADSVQPSAVQLVAGSLTGAGTLVNNGDGSFTYTPGAQETGNISFQYRITDRDGDTDVATATITLTRDSAPQIGKIADVTVDEDGLVGANADNGLPGEVTSTGSASANGTITVDFGSDVPVTLAGSLVLNDSAALDTQLTVNAVPVTFEKVGNDLVGSVGGNEVIRISLTAPTAGPGATEVTYSYTVTLSQAIDQAIPGSEDSDFLGGIGFTVTDKDGTTASGSFGVTIVDDLPTLNVSDAPTSVVEGATANGSWTLDAGADGVTSVTVSFGGTDMVLALTPGNSVSITKPTGTLTVNADGTFSFAAAGNQNGAANPSATFTLSALDRDGDPTSDSLTIAIDDGANPVGGDTLTLTVDEAAIDAIGRTPASNAEVDSGTLDFTAGSDALSGFRFDGVGGLVANLDGAGVDLFWTLSLDGQTITGSLTNGGPAAITISLTAPASIAPGATASATVTVTLADNLPHALAMAAQTQALGNIIVRASDTDGDVATGVVTVQVIDDIPTVSAVAGGANALTVDDSDLAANATANFGFGQPGSLFAVAFNADGPAASNPIVYALGVKSAGVASGLVDTATGQTVVLTNEAGVIYGRTSGSGETVFTLSVDANGTVTLDQQRAVFHTPDSGADQATGLAAADLIVLTATATDSDADPVSATANIGGALTFKDDGADIDIAVVGEAGILLATQDHDTIGVATDTDVSTANFGGAFSAINADYGADGAGSTSWNYVLSLFGADGADSTLDSHGASIFLYDIGGVITGSTAASAAAVNPGNTIFTLGVNAADGTVTLRQLAQIDHVDDGATSNFDSQLATLADGLVKLTGTVTIVDKDGDTDSAAQSIDLGGNIRFFDDGPALDIALKGGAELRIDETNGVVAAGTEIDPDATGSLGSATIAIADLYTVTLDPGADTPTSYSYAFAVGADNPASGYLISATNEVIRLYQTGSGTVEGRGEISGDVAFTFSVAANGTVTMTQLIAIEHANPASHDESSFGMNAGALLLQVTATDFDGDFDTDTLDLGSIVRIEDDGPSITNVAGSGNVTLDETGGLDVNVTSAAAVITASFNFGADGAATANSVVYGLSLTGNGSTSLTTAVGDFAISLVATGPNQITGRYTDGGGTHDAFTVTIGSDGKLTVTQLVALEHLQDGDVPLHNDALTLDGLITASVTITDSDGDSTTATKQVGGQVSFLDDGPSVTATAAGAAIVANDESATNSIAATIDTGAIVQADDPNVGGAGAISIMASGAAVVTATPVYGTDGAAASNPLSYALVVTSATSGLTVTDGSPINLVQIGNVIVGQVSGGAFAGQAAFAIAINPTTGVVMVEQYLSLDHPNAANPDDMVQLLAGTLGVVVTAADSDGDFATSNTVDISAQIRFDDDGPSISNVVGGASVTLDETGGFDSVTSAAPVITAAFAYGADGAAPSGAATYGIELTTSDPDLDPVQVDSGLKTAVGDYAIMLVETSATTIVGRYTDGGGTHDAFTITIGSDGKLTVTQLVALEHLQDGELALHNDGLTLAGLISATVTIKDGDDDTATAKTEIGDQISFLDDGPTANADTKSVLEGAVATGNVLTDNDDSFGADGAAVTSPAGGVVGVRAAGGDTTTPVVTGTGTVISTALGDLTLNADGSYSYDAKPNTTSAAVADIFVYTIRDADGDTSTTTLTITVQPVTLAPDNQTKTVNEAGLDLNQDGADVAAGAVTGSNPAATSETVTGTLTVAGSGVTYAPQSVEDALGKFVLNANGTYTYTLKSAFDGPTLDNDVTTENGVRLFNYTAIDADGNSVPGTIAINIIDDIPTARADTDAVAEDAASPATGNVMTGIGTTNAPGSADTEGADGAAVTGVAAGTPGGDVTGNVGIAVAGSYGALTLGATGGYSYALNNGNAAVQALGVNESLTETFTYTLTDGDGDRTTTTLTITINGTNDAPTIGTAATAVSDEGLLGGLPDSVGTVDTTNLTVRNGTIAVSDPDGDPLTLSLGAPALVLSSGGQPIVWDTTNPQLLLGKVGGNTIISVSINNSGNFTVTLSGPIDHPDMTQEDALSLVVPVSANDGTTTFTNFSALTIGLEDDAPVAIAPLAAALVNAPGSSVYQSLDSDADVDNNYGGDGPGSVIFTAATIAALQAQNLTSDGQPLNYVISAGGTVLTAEKPGGADVFIIRLQPVGHADQYQVEMIGKLDSTQTVDFDDGGYDFVGGNTAWIGFVKPGDNSSQDILITPMEDGADGGTLNANDNTIGVSGGQSVGPDEAVRVDFVVDLTGTPGNADDYGILANQTHAFDSHYMANGASALFSNITTASTVRLVARDDIDSDNDVGDGVKDTINKVAISFNGSTVIVTANGVYNVGGQNYTVSFSGGEATVAGVTADTRIAGFTADGYNSIEFHHAGGNTFKIGDFGAVIQTEDPVNFNVPVTIVDDDGDPAQASLAITTAAPLLVVGSATGDVAGEPTDHVVANPQGQVDGAIQGGAFDDALVGDPGSVAITEGQQANIVLVLDSSGSMTAQIPFGNGTISRQQAMEDGVQALIDSLAASGAKDIRITIIDFDADGDNRGTFDLIINGVVQTQEVTDAKQAVENMSAGGGTNYEDGLQDALSWINGGNGIAGADINKVVFVSDGNPTLWNDAGIGDGGTGNETAANIQASMDQVLGFDGTNEPQQILATGYTIEAVGINVGASPTPGLLDRLSDVEDGVAGAGGGGSATDTTSAEDLAAVLQVVGGSINLAPAGNDSITGGAGADVIFGDVLYTDTLANDLGVNLPAGSGWAVFEALEGRPNLESIDPGNNGFDWTRQDTVAYIRANSAALAKESGRTGGNDIINAGTGNDIVFGQEGNDVINGGDGDDLISGGTGADTLTGGIGIDTFTVSLGESRATIGGTGNGGTITGFDRITDINLAVDILNLQGSPVAAANGAVDGNNSVLTYGGQVIRSHSVTNGVITFDDANSFSNALTISTDAHVAAVVDYLQRNALGSAGTTVAFAAGGRTFIYQQVGTSPSAANDLLVELQGVTVNNLTTLIGTRITPVTLDLDGDGLEFVTASASGGFDYDGDGVREATSWAGRDDGVLVRDANGDGVVNNGGEIVFSVGGSTDLEGVRLQYDSDGDGRLSAADAAFASFGVWQDANGNGITDAGEYRSLVDLGIASIALTADGKPYLAADGEVIVHGDASYTRSDGSTAAVGDASFITGRTLGESQRVAGNQALTSTLVAASLVAVTHGAQADPGVAPKIVADDAAAPSDGAIGQDASALPSEPAPVAAAADLPTTRIVAPTGVAPSVHPDAAPDAAASIGDARDEDWPSDGDRSADAGTPDALFDMIADAGSRGGGTMDGLLSMGGLPVEAAAGGGGAANAPTAAAVLAEVVDSGTVDRLIDAVLGGGAEPVAAGEAPAFDLAHFLDQTIAPDAAAFQPGPALAHELQSMAAA